MAVAAVWNIVAQQLITQVRQGFIKTLPAHNCVIHVGHFCTFSAEDKEAVKKEQEEASSQRV